jgi:hemolysin activation/secretion protein
MLSRWRRVVLGLVLLSAGLTLRAAPMQALLPVKAFSFTGNTVFSTKELGEILKDFTGRELSAVELEAARRAITLHYIRAGYVNSGCLIDTQPITDRGVIALRVVEGKLTQVNVSGLRWMRIGYIRPRILEGAGEPLNLQHLQESMLQLRQRPFIKTMKAELQAGEKRGEGVLDVRVEEAQLAHLSFSADNHRPPSVGAEGIDGALTINNPSGWGDRLGFHFGVLQRNDNGARFPGTDNVGLRYDLPLNPQDTTLQLRFDRRNYGVVEEPFDALDINSTAEYFAIDLRHPLRKSLTEELAVSLTAELRESRTFLGGVPFNLSSGAVNGETRVAVWRANIDYLKRSQQQVFATRITATYGTGALNATDDGTRRDAHFVSIGGQAQYLRELNEAGYKLVVGGAFQWANSPLLSLEQFSIGGAATVRGYRENAVVRDIGLRASIELRLPVGMPERENPLMPETLQLVPFFDIGAAWNHTGATPDPAALPSAGLGLIWNLSEKFDARIFWGYAFDSPAVTSGDLQDHGVHFKVNYNAF